MRFVRLLSAVVIVYGFSYLLYGLRQHFGNVGYQADRATIFLNLNIGIVTFNIGVGLLLAKEWARAAWLAAVTLMLTLHIFLLTLTYLNGIDPTLPFLNVILTLLLFLISWSKLTNSTVKQLFR